MFDATKVQKKSEKTKFFHLNVVFLSVNDVISQIYSQKAGNHLRFQRTIGTHPRLL